MFKLNIEKFDLMKADKGLTDMDVAYSAEVSHTTVWKCKKGDLVRSKTAHKIAKALDVNHTEIFSYVG
jgi:DNA-binding Xre family transcriptional regulator